jgi:phosphoenolpyruvate---glycerone phosphotransferase subunit DhaK
MKKLQNEKAALVDQALAGYALAHRNILRLVEGTHMMERLQPKEKGKVRFLMGNGAGHEPAVIGWVGKGMFDMNVVGDVFSAPNGYAIFDGIKRLSAGGPVLLAVQNHAGDVMNADMAMEMAEKAGINARSVLFYDDIASAPKGMEEERRGMAGMLFYTKIVGAMAERGAGMDELIAMFERVRDRTRTISVALTNCTHPVSGLSMFEGLGEREIEVGMGVHGEGGMGRMALPTSRDLAKMLCEKLIEDGGYREGENMLVLVNGAGGMTMMEMATFYADVHAYLASRGITVADCRVGNFLTTQELSGVSLSFASADEEMISLWHDPCEVSQF